MYRMNASMYHIILIFVNYFSLYCSADVTRNYTIDCEMILPFLQFRSDFEVSNRYFQLEGEGPFNASMSKYFFNL